MILRALLGSFSRSSRRWMHRSAIQSSPITNNPFRNRLTLSRRTMFIRTQETPNPQSMKFLPGRAVLASGQPPQDFQSFRSAQKSPLARRLFQIEGVSGVFFGSDFITVNIADTAEWSVLRPDVFAAIQEFYASGQPLLEEGAATASDTTITEQDSEVVAMIKELIETRIRPSVQEDGGDIVYRGFENGYVYLQMQGSCVGCPSSSVTLKNGIENMLMHYVPEVQGVKEWVDKDVEDASNQQLQKLEQKLQTGNNESSP
eukprot:TRINITY_DN2943_c0_g2_i1.p1 TRINITY_DN2943_c0_g2~~TRINITY_DN2943_c0_g2_i1.p1  ORF type:complete len:259 (+),score=55.19 TRINITY_DN2943_c0_g2_i1:45-821(+)